MSALLAGELRRVLARRLVRVVFALVGIGIVVGGVVTFLKTHPISEAAYQARVKAADEQFSAQTGVTAICPPGATATTVGSASGGGGALSCVPAGIVHVHDPRLHLTSVKGVLEGVTAPLAILACLVGASVIGAEWPSRTITTILTWEPRRTRVHTAKVLGALVVTVVMAVAGLVALGLVLLPSALLHGTTAGVTGAWWWSVAGVVARAAVMVAIAAIIGFSLASLGRNTAAALAVLFAYVVIIENLVARLVNGWERWLITANAAILVSGKALSDPNFQGRTALGAAAYLVALAVGCYLLATAVFRRRDVA